jgi:hypothetical protein
MEKWQCPVQGEQDFAPVQIGAEDSGAEEDAQKKASVEVIARGVKKRSPLKDSRRISTPPPSVYLSSNASLVLWYKIGVPLAMYLSYRHSAADVCSLWRHMTLIEYYVWTVNSYTRKLSYQVSEDKPNTGLGNTRVKARRSNVKFG